MNKKETQKEWESLKIDKKKLDALRKHKEETGVPIAIFVEKAIDEKFDREKTQKTKS